MKRIIFVFLGLLIAISGFSQAGTAATVNLIRTEPISVNQLRTEVQRAEQSAGRVSTHEERLQVLDMMINQRLILQAAERDRILVTDNEVNQGIQQMRNNIAQQIGRQPTDAEFAQAVQSQFGLDIPNFRDQLRKEMIAEKYLIHRKGDLINSIRMPTNEEIQAEYALVRSSLVRPETVLISMIQVPFGTDRARARNQANSLLQEVRTSGFDQVVARSVRPESGYQAGSLGYVPRTQEARNLFGTEFINTAFGLRQGQISGIIEGAQGFQIINIKEYYPQTNLELDDIYQFGTQITVRNYIGQLMLQHRQLTIINQATQELISELRSNRTFTVFENNIRW